MKALLKLEGRIFGLPLQSFKLLGETNPEAKELCNWMEGQEELLNRRRTIVRQMQVANAMKPTK